jgi:hypothetical protein
LREIRQGNIQEDLFPQKRALSTGILLAFFAIGCYSRKVASGQSGYRMLLANKVTLCYSLKVVDVTVEPPGGPGKF